MRRLFILLNFLFIFGIAGASVPSVRADAQVMTNANIFIDSEWHLKKIHAGAAWQYTKGDPNVVIAIIDTGIDSADAVFGMNIERGFNFVSNSDDLSDSEGHGTMDAAVISARRRNSFDVIGIARFCTLLPIKIADGDEGSIKNLVQGIYYAVDQGAKVITISMGSPQFSAEEAKAVNYAWGKGVLICAAAGNSGNSTKNYPAAYENVISVGASNEKDQRCSFSNFGNWVSVAAPGENVVSVSVNNNYMASSGTSIATPQVASLAALLFSYKPDATAESVKQWIESSCDHVGNWVRNGRINARKAFELALSS